MNITLATQMFLPTELDKSIEYADALGVGLEIWPLWHLPEFCKFMDERASDLKTRTDSFHEPYYFCDHSYPRGTKEYERSLSLCRQTFESAVTLGAKNIVFHHNNRSVPAGEKEKMLSVSMENLAEMNALSDEYGIPCLVENAGILPLSNVLFDEDEFIALFDAIPNKCLIDVGHAHCNGWDLSRVIPALKDKIVAYHVHDNDKISDAHKRIGQGTFDIAAFGELYRAYTPNAQLVMEFLEGAEISVSDLKEEIALLHDKVL